MKISSALILATLAVAAFAAESTDAVQVHGRHGQPVMKKVSLAKKQHPAKLVAADLNEGDDDNNSDVLGDPFAEVPFGDTLGFDDEPPVTKGPLFTDSNSGSGDAEDASSLDGSNEDGSADGSGDDEDSSADGSGNGEDSSADGSGVSGDATPVSAYKSAPSNEDVEWELFDHEDGSAGSGGSQDDDEQSSSSGSNAEDAEGSGSNGSGSDESTPQGPVANVQGFDVDDPTWGDNEGTGETKEARAAKLHHEQKAGAELAARAASPSHFSFKDTKPMLLVGSAVGAFVGTLAVVLGVMHLRRQQQRDEQSTLATELPEPPTGREDFEAAAPEAAADALASSSIDLEEALTREDAESESDDDAEEGAFANGSTVV